MGKRSVRSAVVLFAVALSTVVVPDADAEVVFDTKWGTAGGDDGQFNLPAGMTTDASGNVYVAEVSNNRVQKFDAGGAFVSKFGIAGSADGQFSAPSDVAIDSGGNIYVVDNGNQRIQKFDSAGIFVTKWGTGPLSSDGNFNSPIAIAIDGSDNIYVTDEGNGRVQKFNTSGVFQSKFPTGAMPQGIATDASGNVYVADKASDAVLEYNSSGTLLAAGGSLNNPEGLDVDSAGNIFVANTSSNNVKRLTVSGANILVQQTIGSNGSGDGQFSAPFGLVVNDDDDFYVSEFGNSRVQAFVQVPGVPTLTGTNPTSPANNNTVNVQGTADANTTVQLFTDPGCTTAIGPATPSADFAAPGIPITLADNSRVTFFATAEDSGNDLSACSSTSVTYVEDSIAPTTTITGPARTRSRRPRFSFTAPEQATFECAFDLTALSACTSPFQSPTRMRFGVHTVHVQATDAAGNVGPIADKPFKILRP